VASQCAPFWVTSAMVLLRLAIWMLRSPGKAALAHWHASGREPCSGTGKPRRCLGAGQLCSRSHAWKPEGRRGPGRRQGRAAAIARWQPAFGNLQEARRRIMMPGPQCRRSVAARRAFSRRVRLPCAALPPSRPADSDQTPPRRSCQAPATQEEGEVAFRGSWQLSA
jgi:hypothetical protein